MRRMVPLTNCVPDDAGAIVRTGIFPATAVPRRVAGLGSVTAPIDVTLADGFMCQAVISAQRKPASSRAIAVTTTVLMSLRATSRWNRPHSRRWAAQERAMVSAGRPSCRLRNSAPT
jgi:hypothetical protein